MFLIGPNASSGEVDELTPVSSRKEDEGYDSSIIWGDEGEY